MQITLNGEAINIEENYKIADLLAKFELSPQKVAIELNREIVPVDKFNNTELKNGDQIEIVEFVGGG